MQNIVHSPNIGKWNLLTQIKHGNMAARKLKYPQECFAYCVKVNIHCPRASPLLFSVSFSSHFILHPFPCSFGCWSLSWCLPPCAVCISAYFTRSRQHYQCPNVSVECDTFGLWTRERIVLVVPELTVKFLNQNLKPFKSILKLWMRDQFFDVVIPDEKYCLIHFCWGR